MVDEGQAIGTCACTMPAMEPGRVSVGTAVVSPDAEPAAPTGLIAPAICGGLVTPNPFRKIVTVDPAAVVLGFSPFHSESDILIL